MKKYEVSIRTTSFAIVYVYAYNHDQAVKVAESFLDPKVIGWIEEVKN